MSAPGHEGGGSTAPRRAGLTSTADAGQTTPPHTFWMTARLGARGSGEDERLQDRFGAHWHSRSEPGRRYDQSPGPESSLIVPNACRSLPARHRRRPYLPRSAAPPGAAGSIRNRPSSSTIVPVKEPGLMTGEHASGLTCGANSYEPLADRPAQALILGSPHRPGRSAMRGSPPDREERTSARTRPANPRVPLVSRVIPSLNG